jgi:squalene-hopene/tetraprenyl-beta-curcumene cyclase
LDGSVDCTAGAVERGTRFLLARQGRDGLWRDFATPAGEASCWPTGYIGSAVPLTGSTADALDRAADTLIAAQNLDGGWGYNENVPTDADSTAWVLRFLIRLGRTGDPCRRAASCLISHQRNRTGGVATYLESNQIRRFMGLSRWVPFWGWCAAHTEVTAAACQALTAASPDDSRSQAQAAWRFVRSRQRADGCWSSYWWTSPHFATLQAIEFALAVGDWATVRRGVQWTIVNQDRSGGWKLPGADDSAFATALALSILLRADADDDHVDRGVMRLLDLQQADGGWSSLPIMRIPLPPDTNPDGEGPWQPVRFGSGVVVADQHRTFTSATCVAALALPRTRRSQ